MHGKRHSALHLWKLGNVLCLCFLFSVSKRELYRLNYIYIYTLPLSLELPSYTVTTTVNCSRGFTATAAAPSALRVSCGTEEAEDKREIGEEKTSNDASH